MLSIIPLWARVSTVSKCSVGGSLQNTRTTLQDSGYLSNTLRLSTVFSSKVTLCILPVPHPWTCNRSCHLPLYALINTQLLKALIREFLPFVTWCMIPLLLRTPFPPLLAFHLGNISHGLHSEFISSRNSILLPFLSSLYTLCISLSLGLPYRTVIIH